MTAPPPIALRHELRRKLIHLTSCGIPIAYSLGVPHLVLQIALIALVIIALGVEFARSGMARFRSLFLRFTAPMLRVHEHVQWSGATWLLIALLVAFLALDRPTAIAAMWAATAGDPAAALVGRTLGRVRFPGGKSLEGSIACAVVTALGAAGFAHLPLELCVVSGVAASIGEMPNHPFDDNVRTVTAVACGILLWRLAFS